MPPRISWIVLLAACVALSDLAACARRPVFPDQSSAAALQPLALDGTWRLMSGKASSVFRIDKGRMFFVERRKPSRAHLAYLRGATSASDGRTAAELDVLPGGLLARGIRETDDPRIFSCQVASVGGKPPILGYGRGEIKVVSGSEIMLRSFPNSATSLGETLEQRYWLESLDAPSWFEKLVVGNTTEYAPAAARRIPRSSQLPKEAAAVEVRKVLIVPLERMESGGKLSKHAKAFIEQAVQDAGATRGSVEIRYPSNAPGAVVEGLMDLGVRTFLDEQRSDFELLIIKRNAR